MASVAHFIVFMTYTLLSLTVLYEFMFHFMFLLKNEKKNITLVIILVQDGVELLVSGTKYGQIL